MSITPTQASAEAARICAEAVRLCLYKDQRFRKEPEPRRIPEALELIELDPAAAAGFTAVNATCAGVELARELVAPLRTLSPQLPSPTRPLASPGTMALSSRCSSAATAKPRAWGPSWR